MQLGYTPQLYMGRRGLVQKVRGEPKSAKPTKHGLWEV